MNWPICSVVAEGVDLGVSGFAIHRTAAVSARGYNQCGMNGDAASARPKFSPERKDALESQVRLLDISLRFGIVMQLSIFWAAALFFLIPACAFSASNV